MPGTAKVHTISLLHFSNNYAMYLTLNEDVRPFSKFRHGLALRTSCSEAGVGLSQNCAVQLALTLTATMTFGQSVQRDTSSCFITLKGSQRVSFG